MRYFDTHAHLDYETYQENFDGFYQNLMASGVEKVVIPGVTLAETPRIIDLIDKYENLYAAVGIHPSDAKTFDENSIEALRKYAENPKVVGIGETGLDYYHDKTFNEIQKECFIAHIKLANELEKPLIIHDRDAHRDTFDVIKQYKSKNIDLIMHCFSGSVEFAKECIKEGYYIAIGGVVTFKNAKVLKEVAKEIPLEKLVIETDAPFLTPHPFRGETNSPEYLKYVAVEIAGLKGISAEEVCEATFSNGLRVFNLI